MEHKGMVISILIGSFGKISKGLLKEQEVLEIGERPETMQTTVLLRSTKKWEEC